MRFNNVLRRMKLAAALILVTLLVACATPAGESKAPTKKTPPPRAEVAESAASAQSRAAYRQALAALKAGRYPEAEQALIALTKREPRLAGPFANLGIVYARTGREPQAIEALQQAIRIGPERPGYHNELGMLWRQQGKFDEARRAYQRALALDENYALAHMNLGILYDLYHAEPGKALPHYERYLALVPADAASTTKWIADARQRSGIKTVERKEQP